MTLNHLVMTAIQKWLFPFVLMLFMTSGLAQDQKRDSLLNLLHKAPQDSIKVDLLHSLQLHYLYSDIDKSKKYAKDFLDAAKSYGTKIQVGEAYRMLAIVQRSLGNKDSCKVYLAKAAKIYQNEEYPKGIINTNKDLAILYDESGRDDEAIKLLLKNVEKEIQIKDSVFLANDYKHLAGIYLDKSNYEIALQYCIKALNLLEKLDDNLRYADALGQMANIELSLGNRTKAVDFYKKALGLYIEEDDKFYQGIAYDFLGSNLSESGDYEEAEDYLHKGLSLARKMKSPVVESLLLHSMGNHQTRLSNYNQAIKYLNAALVLAKKNNRVENIVSIYYSIANARQKNGDYENALENVNQGITVSNKINSIESYSILLKLRSEIYQKTKNKILAFEDYKRHIILKDSFFNIEKANRIEELKTIYETEKKEQQISQQETEINLLEEREKVSNLQKLVLGGGLVLSLVAIGFGFYGFRQRTKKNQLEKEKVEAELAFKKKQLTTHALHLAKKNEVLEGLKQKAAELKKREGGGAAYQEMIKTINFDQQDDKAWENFTQYFEAVHTDFAKQAMAKYPDISKNELRLMALMKMNLSSKEIANILNISSDGVKKARQRLRKKMDLSPDDSLETTVMAI